eukprot:TRINITY_DN37866_c0_g1_i1.p1 TRINITY_DN37866_c0_g1~~TRINITY_DN37866_c0_g1_i1.p1  ORF type:complete len:309 (+),score=63.93 TRINITY_DN37866_c0_g1_i1:527-1453(+)
MVESCFKTLSGMEDDAIDELTTYQSESKKRRLTVDQVRSLERSFEMESKLEPEKKLQLAQELGMQPRQVAVWFQNRRARWKTKQLEREFTCLKADYESLRSSFESLQQEKISLLSELDSLKKKLGDHRDVLDTPGRDNGAIQNGTSDPKTQEIKDLPDLAFYSKADSAGSEKIDTEVKPVRVLVIKENGNFCNPSSECSAEMVSEDKQVSHQTLNPLFQTAVSSMKYLSPNHNDSITSSGDDVDNQGYVFLGEAICGMNLPPRANKLLRADDISGYIHEDTSSNNLFATSADDHGQVASSLPWWECWT